MKIQFLGAAGTVTGSKSLVTDGAARVLVDCGLFQGFKSLRRRNRAPLPIEPSALDAVVLTHAHLDHSGYIPLLVKNGFRGKVYCTPATKELCGILLPDSGWLQEEAAAHASRKGYTRHRPAVPLYTREDAVASLESLRPVAFDEEITVADGLKARWSAAGHILGAASIRLSGSSSVLFSGDLGRPEDDLMLAPADPQEASTLVVESTYGNRLHAREEPSLELARIVRETSERGGITLVPSFAVGRTQKILVLLHRLKESGDIPDLPVYVNSPMATNVTDLQCRYLEHQRPSADKLRRAFEAVQYVSSVEASRRLSARREPAVILSASGMATGGRVLHHLRALLPSERNSIVFTGFQAGGTRGRQLVEGAESVKMFGEWVPVRARVSILHGLSAHADRRELLDWMARMPRAPRRVFVNHGEPEAADALRHAIAERFGWSADVPDQGDSWSVD